MPTHMVRLVPGVNTELTPSLNQAAYQTTNLIRWSPSGQAQKIGGWTKFYSQAIGSEITALHAWEDTSGVLHLASGAQDQLGVITDGTLQDVTPLVITYNIAVSFSTTNDSNQVIITNTGSDPNTYSIVNITTQVSVGGLVLFGLYQITVANSADSYTITAASNATSTVSDGGAVPSFASTSGSSQISVTLDNHGYSVGDTFPILVPTIVGGLTLSGFYTVSAVADANDFTIVGANNASSSQTVSMNGGDVQIVCWYIPAPILLATGFGINGFGDGEFGTGTSIPAPADAQEISATDYTLDNWGADLIACPDNGPIFYWQPDSGIPIAQIIWEAPSINTGVFVSMPSQIMVAYGISTLGVQDPLLLGWCNAGDFTDWVASVTNLAGTYRIPRGSAIIGGMQGPLFGLIWTDIDLWAMSFIGYPDVFGFSELATGCGLIAKFGATILGTTIYWMSQKQFFSLPSGGGATPLPCPVWDVIFQQLDTNNLSKIRAATNSQFGEVIWFFPVAGGNGQNSMYVKYTPMFNAWDYGEMDRSAWIDQSVYGAPIAADSNLNYIYQHETSPDADGSPINASFSTGFFALSDGAEMMFVDQCYPDFVFSTYGGNSTASIQIAFSYANYAQSTVYSTMPYTCTSDGLSFLNPRFRGRLASISVSSQDMGSFWRLGGIRIRSAADGRI